MNIRVIKSGRKTISIEVTPECDVIVRAPYLTSRREIARMKLLRHLLQSILILRTKARL